MTVPRDSAAILADLVGGYRQTAILYAAVQLGVFAALDDGALDLPTLAQRLAADSAALRRLLRGLVVLGVVEEVAGAHTLTDLGRAMRNGPTALARLAGAEYVTAWMNLAAAVRSGSPAFDTAFGCGVWEHRERHPELSADFNTWLGERTERIAETIAAGWDFADVRCVVDVGGGCGALISAILERHPRASGVLFDRPETSAASAAYLTERGLQDRCRVIGGDFFESVPRGGDVYLLKSILHDWDDESCRRLLKAVRAAAVEAPLLVVERVVDEGGAADADAVLLDLHMLAVTGGRERTAAELDSLFAAVGCAVVSRRPLSAGPWLLEVRPTRADP